MQNIGSPHHDLRYNPDFYDVTLVDEDQQTKANTIVFTANSSFVRAVFIRNANPHPIIYTGAKGQRCIGWTLDIDKQEFILTLGPYREH